MGPRPWSVALRSTMLAAACALAASHPSAAGNDRRGAAWTLGLAPARVRPGDAFLVTVRGPGAAGLAPGDLAGTVAGRALSFFPIPGGAVAFGALPLETPPGPLPVRVAAGAATVARDLLVTAPAFPQRRLEVDPRFVEPPDPALQARIDEDRAAFAKAFAQPPVPPLFSGSFVLPRRARVTAGYGEQRTLNAVKPSQHYGMDLAGKIGAPVAASNAGEVVLVRDCWASGRTVILSHGAGVYTTYFHLSRILVEPGQRVARGQRIGLVGGTGRVSGPHLHWGVRVGDLYVDPASVLRLRLRVAAPAARTR